MRAPSLLRPLPLALALAASLPAWAQTGTPAPTPVEQPRLPAGEAQVIERITHEDAGSRIDEVRIGGQTRSIDVQPKNGSPAYEIAPQRGAELPTEGQGSSGRSRWRLLSF
ncbi:hypothetical protein [Hydrogenophaga pseudoflava]|uniref:hypothetical protein n=1 Tax=Hydrogenophaga pseudoflava TaxID=47421 RepID=UPI0027E57238|nr:hypothetical protein [Hydrogenophaga pseudoflava]MDQ7743978.1 hypothetical protein [Hydrogenophaga pseudoflava]